MIVYRANSHISVTLDTRSALGAGGEARVLPVVGEESLVAKIYHDASLIDGRKLRAMIGNPPDDPDHAAGHCRIAWPVDLLADSNSRTLGFLMPRVRQMRPLIDFYNPSKRRQNCPRFNYFYLHQMAQNLATAFKVLHDRGYVVGDVNERNVLGSERALVTLVDADSFQVRDGSGQVFRCTVGTPEFTPPELSGKSFGQVDRAPEHDRFGLGVLIFQLLMEGVHPFSGKYLGSGDPPLVEKRIASGHFPHGRGHSAPYAPLPTALPIETMDPELRALMEQCFNDGHKAPSKRPEAGVWKTALLEAQGRLSQCRVQPVHHRYGRHLNACPWCERARLMGGRDPFAPAPPAPVRPALRPRTAPRAGRPNVPPHAPWTPPAVLNLFAYASLIAGVTGFCLGSWGIVAGIFSVSLGVAGLFKSRRTRAGKAMSAWGTLLGLVLLGVSGSRSWMDQAGPVGEVAHELEFSQRKSEAKELITKFIRDLSIGTTDTGVETAPGAPALPDQINGLGLFQTIDITNFESAREGDYFVQGVAKFTGGQRHFSAHLSYSMGKYGVYLFLFSP